MKLFSKRALSVLMLAGLMTPTVSFAFSFSAWIPFWKKQEGAAAMSLVMEKFANISPFSYEVNANGTLKDSLKMSEGFWPNWTAALKDGGIKIIPTIAFLDGDQIHALLSNKTKRIKHEDTIAALVRAQKYDGIDIDYEDKWAKTKDYFNTFIYGLALRLHAQNKILSCTLESRVPLADRFSVVPKDMAYANDYVTLNKYCDQFRIMAYDQGSIDLNLNKKKGNGELYMPVADPVFVEKVIKETLKMVPAKKIMLGIPTYGYEYEVSWKDGVATYKRLRSHTFFQAMNVADRVNATPVRNSAGELSFVYATSTSVDVSSRLTYSIFSTTSPAGLITTAGAITRYVTMSDAGAIMDKIKLAKKYGLKGAVFFKMDGDIDPALWNILKS